MHILRAAANGLVAHFKEFLVGGGDNFYGPSKEFSIILPDWLQIMIGGGGGLKIENLTSKYLQLKYARLQLYVTKLQNIVVWGDFCHKKEKSNV